MTDARWGHHTGVAFWRSHSQFYCLAAFANKYEGARRILYAPNPRNGAAFLTQQSMRSNTWAHSLSLSLCYSAADEYRWLSNLFPFLRSEASADIRHACVSNLFSNSTSPPHMWRALFNFAFASSSSSSRNTHTYALCMCPYCLDLHILLGDSWAETDACAPGTECDCDCVLENSIYELQ